MTYFTKILSALWLFQTFIFPNPQGWTTISPGAGGIHQYMVMPGPGQIAPNGARMAPTWYQNTVPAYRPAVPTYQPSLPGYEDDDDE